MALKRGPIVPGIEPYYGTTIAPQLTAAVTTADAGGAAVAATFMGNTSVDQPLLLDMRMMFVYWDKSYTGSIDVTPVVNGVALTAQKLTIAAQAGAGKTYKPFSPNTFAVGHGDTLGFTVTCNGAFTCTGTMSVLAVFSGAGTVQPTLAAWSPS